MSLAKRMYLLDNTALKLSLTEEHNREVWVYPINAERDEFGEYHHLNPQLRMDPNKFKDFFRMSPETFDYILNQVAPLIEKNTTNYRKPIAPEERLAVTLRFLATGLSFSGLAYTFRMGASTVASIVAETCEALWDVLQPIHMPTPNETSCKKVEEGFRTKWNFPNCFGCVDGKHIRVICPRQSGSQF